MHTITRPLCVFTGGLLIITFALAGFTPAYSAPPSDPGENTLALIENTIIPPQDRIDLARRLLGVTDIPAPPTSAPELTIGDIRTFQAENSYEDYSFQVDAQLVYKTDHVYMFIEIGYDYDPDAVQRSADTLENVIRPKVHEIFGTEWIPGIDGDPHLYVLNVSDLGDPIAGYYSSASQYPVEAVPTSNAHEMFFINLDNMLSSIGSDYYDSVLAHEFQHMVHWNVDSNETSWINEGMSELAMLVTGYPRDSRITTFLRQPNIQLTTWPETDRGIHYGSSLAFAAYFYQRFGAEATTTLVRDQANGMASVENTLRAINATDPLTGAAISAVDLFGDWVSANYLQNADAADGRYGYTLPGLEDLPQAAITKILTTNGTLYPLETPQWGANYLRLIGDSTEDTVTITFKGQESVQLVPTDAYSGEYAWWSNRADNSDMRLTRAFDLTHVSRATLNYWVWYHTERLWDYGYAMVSIDSGLTWTPLATAHTTTENPHHNAYGAGYTGASGKWIEETVDLTPYVGREIMLRFEYITDDAINQPGLMIDDVRIPEIGYEDDFENGSSDWLAEGWILTNNVLPQRFLVQIIQPNNPAAPVTRVLGPDDLPHGEWTIQLGGAAGDAIIAVAGLAPVTTEPASYTVRVETH
ncbi:MAG: immune inhibitor A [Anaerolineae bacterium]|nr:immune inhibitor A [Anaerolineae bacterium]